MKTRLPSVGSLLALFLMVCVAVQSGVRVQGEIVQATFSDAQSGKEWKLERFDNANHKGHIKMGMDPSCDDGKTNLTMDYPEAIKIQLVCFARKFYPLVKNMRNKKTCEPLPPSTYHPDHYCSFTKIQYEHPIPVIEGHRPVWPKFGEYRYVPAQRWLHSIEHGSIVMLYHPCADSPQIQRLRSLVTSCVRKYIITAAPNLDPNFPMALAAWGCRLELNYVNDKEVIKFIKKHALKGPEGPLEKEGQYTHDLILPASYPKGFLPEPDKDAQGQIPTVCPGESLERHYTIYDSNFAVPIRKPSK